MWIINCENKHSYWSDSWTKLSNWIFCLFGFTLSFCRDLVAHIAFYDSPCFVFGLKTGLGGS